VNLSPLIQVANSLVILGTLALALGDLIRRPSDHYRLARGTRWAMGPGWAALAVAAVASAWLFPGGPGYWKLLVQFAAFPAVGLLMGGFFLEAGSIWAWRGGLRGRGFGWMRPPRRWREIIPLKPLLAGAAAANGLTFAVFLLMSSRVAIHVNPQFEASQQEWNYAGQATTVLLLAQLIVAPFFEETLFRHYLQSRLACWFGRHGVTWWAAAAPTSALWPLGHAGLLQPGWVKYCQVFPLGLLLGWLQRRWGVGLSMAVHLSLNIGVFLYAPWMTTGQ